MTHDQLVLMLLGLNTGLLLVVVYGVRRLVRRDYT